MAIQDFVEDVQKGPLWDFGIHTVLTFVSNGILSQQGTKPNLSKLHASYSTQLQRL